MFGNPCTMQIIVKHWTDDNLKSPAKLVNAPLIKKYTGVENYVEMCRRVRRLETTDKVPGSSNFGKFINLFENSDSRWIDKINDSLE